MPKDEKVSRITKRLAIGVSETSEGLSIFKRTIEDMRNKRYVSKEEYNELETLLSEMSNWLILFTGKLDRIQERLFD